jgi:iron complex transport system substrate-binding protein
LARETARRVGAPLVEVKEAASFADVRQNLRRIGAAVGEPARAEALVRSMDAELAALSAERARPPRRVVAWSGGTAAPGKDTMTNTIIEAAGAVNVAALPGANASTFEVEQLAVARPDALLFGGTVADQPSLARQAGRHRLVRRLYDGRRIAFPEPAYTCGLPQSATAARDLKHELRNIPPIGTRP